jgi:hypothetical protein
MPDGDWLAWPTLSAGGGGQIKVSGVYYHTDALREAIARFGTLAMAVLVVEQAGEYAGAVRVTVGGEVLGSIPHALAPAFRDAVDHLHRAGLPATCRATLEADDSTDAEYVDVFVWAGPKPRSDGEPFLPPGLGPPVQLFDGQVERLALLLQQSKAKSKRIVKVGELISTDPGWCLTLDAEPVGLLDSGADGRLHAAHSAGFPLTCRVRIIKESERPLRVLADLPKDLPRQPGRGILRRTPTRTPTTSSSNALGQHTESRSMGPPNTDGPQWHPKTLGRRP